MTKSTTFLLIIILLFSCGGKTNSSTVDKTKTQHIDSSATESDEMICKYSDSNYEFEFEGCVCGENTINSDTIFIDLGEYGGEIQGNFIRITRPKLDNSYYMLIKHQNRLATSNMGPDIVLDKWLLYNSPYDTLRYRNSENGFYIDAIPHKEQSKFVKYAEDDFFLAYYRSAEEGYVSQDTLDNPPKSEVNKYKKNKDHILDLTSPELHRIILELKHGNKTEKVIIFTYGHMG